MRKFLPMMVLLLANVASTMEVPGEDGVPFPQGNLYEQFRALENSMAELRAAVDAANVAPAMEIPEEEAVAVPVVQRNFSEEFGVLENRMEGLRVLMEQEKGRTVSEKVLDETHRVFRQVAHTAERSGREVRRFFRKI
ncbi:MAG: hypothetical protein LBJ96_04495 [Holosporaceae bacterium]|jgi:hypothetical protein|nr:hypothetical protein [Holosporaceae bacterium]